MATTNKFKPKASKNAIEGATPIEETEATTVTEETSQTDAEEEALESMEGETPDTMTDEQTEEVTDSGENPETAPPTVQFDTASDKKAPAEKNVRVALNRAHSCSIGGERYHFEKGKQYNVPASVKTILKQAGLLMPL